MSSCGSQRPSLKPAKLLAWVALLACANAWCLTPARAVQPATLTASQAQNTAGAARWASLSAQQRNALKPLEKDWSGMDTNSQEKWLSLVNRFPAMSEAERERVQARMTEWARTPATERGKARLRYQHAKEISPQERQAQWTAYQNLPVDERRKLVDDAAKKQKASTAAAASTPPSATSRSIGTTPSGSAAKSNIVSAPKPGENTLKAITPTVVQAKPGATTNLVSKRSTPAPHLQPGLPKVAATPGLVDSATLLPRQGPQGIKAPAPESGASGAAPTHPKKS